MVRSADYLTKVLMERSAGADSRPRTFFEQASEVIVFGSMSAGLDRPDSDIDVLCIGGKRQRHKTARLDVVIVPLEATENHEWLQSELASHVGKYGIWVKGTPTWRDRTVIGGRASGEKRRRIAAFMRSLPRCWFRLDEGFRAKYSIKLRRESQRLELIEQGVAIPPTRVLDDGWTTMSESCHSVPKLLAQFAKNTDRFFLSDLIARAKAGLGTHSPRVFSL